MRMDESCNAERTRTGKYCYGKTPLQTFIESATLAYDFDFLTAGVDS